MQHWNILSAADYRAVFLLFCIAAFSPTSLQAQSTNAEHPDSLEAQAKRFVAEQNYKDAETLYRAALKQRRQQGGDSALAFSINAFAEFLSERVRYAEAEPFF